MLDNYPFETKTPTPEELATKYNVPIEDVLSQLSVGMKIELEHTPHEKVAREIALDHLGEKLSYYQELEKIDEVKIDNASGLGNVPDNSNVDYLGLKVKMTPKTFLKLAASISRDKAESADFIKTHLENGGAIASPWLVISTPPHWDDGNLSDPAQVTGHEGRNRMFAVLETEGNVPVEVHLFFNHGVRNRDITKEWIDRLNAGIKPERINVEIPGPLFMIDNQLDEEDLEEVYPGQSSGRLKNYIKKKYGGEITCRKVSQLLNDPDVNNFYKKRAKWYKSLHCKGNKQVREDDDAPIESGAALTIFDIDDTLFKTTAKIKVINDQTGEEKELDQKEFNDYKLQDGERFDFSDFENSELFHATSIPIKNIWKTAQNTLGKIGKRPGSRMVIVTARKDFDDKDMFLDTFKKHGLDMKKVHVYRSGNLDLGSSSANKKAVIKKLLNSGNYTEVRLFDDHLGNLNAFLELKNEFENVTFKAFPVSHNGIVGKPIIV